jgi:hypothetical protein
MTNYRSDLLDATCSECGARCVPGQTHLEHNLGWKKNVLMWNYLEEVFSGYPGWDLVERSGSKPAPSFIELTIRHNVDKGSDVIAREFDDIAIGKFYYREWQDDGCVCLGSKSVYHSGWHFQKREDAYKFYEKYGGIAK